VKLVRSLSSLFLRDGGGPSRTGCVRPAAATYRPSVEGLEDRVVPAAPGVAAPVLGPALFSAHGHHHQAASVLPVRVTDVTAQNG
jgi:hypothetical protein